MKIKLYTTLLMLLSISSFILAQGFISDVSKKGTSAAPFLSIGQGTRAVAMGSAYVALAEDQSAIYWNPAGLAKLQGGGVLVEHTNWIADINYNYLAATYSLGGMGTIGISFITSDIEDMKVTTIEDPDGTGEIFSVSDAAFSIAYAISLTDNFSIGFNPKFIHQKIWKMSATAFAVDLGVQYITPFEGIVLGMSISNFGTKMRLDGTSSLVLFDPDPESTGNNGKIPAYLETEEWELPVIFRVGLAYNPIKTDMHTVTLAVDALHPSDDYESVNAGIEYTFSNLLSIRGGYKSLFLQDSEESFTFGVGIQQRLLGNLAFKVDYAYGNFNRLKNMQKFSLNILF